MTEVVHLTVVRVVRDRSWFDQQTTLAGELEAALRSQARARGLTIVDVGALDVVAGSEGTWARLTRTATAS